MTAIDDHEHKFVDTVVVNTDRAAGARTLTLTLALALAPAPTPTPAPAPAPAPTPAPTPSCVLLPGAAQEAAEVGGAFGRAGTALPATAAAGPGDRAVPVR